MNVARFLTCIVSALYISSFVVWIILLLRHWHFQVLNHRQTPITSWLTAQQPGDLPENVPQDSNTYIDWVTWSGFLIIEFFYYSDGRVTLKAIYFQHRDIKSMNVFITSNLVCQVLRCDNSRKRVRDFREVNFELLSLYVFKSKDSCLEFGNILQVADFGMCSSSKSCCDVAGTPQWMAPEVLSQRITVRCLLLSTTQWDAVMRPIGRGSDWSR